MLIQVFLDLNYPPYSCTLWVTLDVAYLESKLFQEKSATSVTGTLFDAKALKIVGVTFGTITALGAFCPRQNELSTNSSPSWNKWSPLGNILLNCLRRKPISARRNGGESSVLPISVRDVGREADILDVDLPPPTQPLETPCSSDAYRSDIPSIPNPPADPSSSRATGVDESTQVRRRNFAVSLDSTGNTSGEVSHAKVFGQTRDAKLRL
ncbi:hypothetical protein AMATHDRAFT_51283 [Amanita thiersii Skay4041]|uniref:Uncharacterized protein n=1 Tax=Amanita thiersii Skay4041 TaxID=703135 RepID=A0A2A9N740_9AGAR|nr:hypothetical protein AMATHDRAFT_51283 [Amanita thiersii Skay4041]